MMFNVFDGRLRYYVGQEKVLNNLEAGKISEKEKNSQLRCIELRRVSTGLILN